MWGLVFLPHTLPFPARRCQGNAAQALPKVLAAATLERATRECGRDSAGPAERAGVGAAPEHPRGDPGARRAHSIPKRLRDELCDPGILPLGFSFLLQPGTGRRV